MGNKAYKEQKAASKKYDVNSTCSKLIEMGFDMQLCIKASEKYPNNVAKAIEYASKTESKNETKASVQIKKNNKIEKKQLEHKEKDPPKIDCIVSECVALNRLIETLKFYKAYNDNSKNNIDEFCDYLDKNKQYIVNDYHHVLDVHLNEGIAAAKQNQEQFKLIYNKVMDKTNELQCDITGCQIYLRNNRQREKQTASDKIKDASVLAAIDILDCIHCYFIHSVDIGYRIVEHRENVQQNERKNDGKWKDEELIQLKTSLREKQNNIREIRGNNRFKTNKFMTEVNSTQAQVEQKQVDNKQDDISNFNEDKWFSFGNAYYYDKNDTSSYGEYVAPTYKSLKEEMLMNKLHSIQKESFDSAYEKAVYLKNHSKVVTHVLGDVELILAVIFYTDYDILSFHFSQTFRTNNDTNSQFAHWSKFLKQVVNHHGTKIIDSHIAAFYHGASMLYFDQFIGMFNSPTSTTTKLAVASIFAKNDGVILELNVFQDDLDYEQKSAELSYFDCSLISCYANEDEKLFFMPGDDWSLLQIVSIRNMKTNENYKDFIQAIRKLDEIFSNMYHIGRSGGLSEKEEKFLNQIFDYPPAKNQKIDLYPQYIIKAFERFQKQFSQISVQRNNKSAPVLSLRIWNGKEKKVMNVAKINNVFTKADKIVCWGTFLVEDWNLFYDDLYQSLTSVNNLCYSKVKTIAYRNAMRKEDMIPKAIIKRFASIGWNILSARNTSALVMKKIVDKE